MNHTERIAETARRQRHLTQRVAKQAIETYLELLAEEIAEGRWVDIYGLGKMQESLQAGSGAENLRQYPRLQSQIRLSEGFKRRYYISHKG